jgi:hypothetical protein
MGSMMDANKAPVLIAARVMDTLEIFIAWKKLIQ